MPRLIILFSSVISLLATSLLLEISCGATVDQKEYLNTPIKYLGRNDKPSWKGESLKQSRPRPSHTDQIGLQTRLRPRPKKNWAWEASLNDAVHLGLLSNSRYPTVLKHKRCICGSACEELNKFSHGCPKSCGCRQHNRIASLHFNQKVRSINGLTSNEVANSDKGQAGDNQTDSHALQELQTNDELNTNKASTSQIAELDPEETQEMLLSRLAEIEEGAGDLLVKFKQLEDAVLRKNTEQDDLQYRKKRRGSKAHVKKIHGGQYARLRGFPQHFYELKRSGSPYTSAIPHKGNVGFESINDNSLVATRANVYEPKNTDVHETPTKNVADVYANKYIQRGQNFRKVPKFKNRSSKINHRYNKLIKERSHPCIFKDNYQPKNSLVGDYVLFKFNAEKLGSLSSLNYKRYSGRINYNNRNSFTTAAMEDVLPEKRTTEDNLPEKLSSNIELNKHYYRKTPTATKIEQDAEKLPPTLLADNFIPQRANFSKVDFDDEELINNNYPINTVDYILSKPKGHNKELSDIQCNDQEHKSQFDENPPSTLLLAPYVPLVSDFLGSTTEKRDKLEVVREEENLLDTEFTECPSTTDLQEDDAILIPPHTFLLDNYIPMVSPDFLQDEDSSFNLTGGGEKANTVISSFINNDVLVDNLQNVTPIPDLVHDFSLPAYGSLNVSQPFFKDDLPVQSCQFDNTAITNNEPSVSTDFHINENIHGDITEVHGKNGYNGDITAEPLESCIDEPPYSHVKYETPKISLQDYDFEKEGNENIHGDITEVHGENGYNGDINAEPLESCIDEPPYSHVKYEMPKISLQDYDFEKEGNSERSTQTPVLKPTSWAQVYLPQDFRVHVSDENSDDNSDGGCIPDGSLYNNDNLKRHVDNSKEEIFPLLSHDNLLSQVHSFKKNAFKSRLNALSKTQQLEDKARIPKCINDSRILTTTRNVKNTLTPIPEGNAIIKSCSQRKTLQRRNLSRVSKHKSLQVNPLTRNSLHAKDYADISRKPTSSHKNMLKISHHPRHIPTKNSLYQANSPYTKGRDYLREQNLHDLTSIKTKKHAHSHIFKEKLPITNDNTESLCGENLQVANFANINPRKANEFPLNEDSIPKPVKRMGKSIGPQLKKFYKLIAEHFSTNYQNNQGDTKLHKGMFYNIPGHHIVERFPITDDVYEGSWIKGYKHTCDIAHLQEKCSDGIKWHLGNLTASNQNGANKKIMDRLPEVNLPYLKGYKTNCHGGNSCEVVHQAGEHKIAKRILPRKAILHNLSLFHDKERSHIVREHKGLLNKPRLHSTKNCKQIIDQLLEENLPYLKQHGLDLDPVTLNIAKDHKHVKRHLHRKFSGEINDQKLDLHKKHSHILEHKGISNTPISHSIKNCKQILDQLLKDNIPYLEHHGLDLKPSKLNKIKDHKLDKRHLPKSVSCGANEYKLDKTHPHKTYLHIIGECRGIHRRSRSVEDCKLILDQLLKDNVPYMKKFELHSTKVRLDRSSPYKVIERELIEWQALNENVPVRKTYDSVQPHLYKDFIFSAIGYKNNSHKRSILNKCESDATSYNGSMHNVNVSKASKLGWIKIAEDYTANVGSDSKDTTLKNDFSLGKHDKSDLCKVSNQSTVNVSNTREGANAVNGTNSSKSHAHLSEDNSYYEVNDAGERIVCSQNSDVVKRENNATKLIPVSPNAVNGTNSSKDHAHLTEDNSYYEVNDAGERIFYSQNSDVVKREQKAAHLAPAKPNAMNSTPSSKEHAHLNSDIVKCEKNAADLIPAIPNAVNGTNSSKDLAHLSEDNLYYEVNDAGEREMYSQNPDDGKSEKDVAHLIPVSVLKNEVNGITNTVKLAVDEDAVPAQRNTVHDLQKDDKVDKKKSLDVNAVTGHESGWMWTTWTVWSPCSVTCGKGRVTRHRKCVVKQCKDGTEEELHEKTCQMPACGLKGFFGLFKE